MKLNLLLLGIAAVLIAIVTYRMGVITLNKKFWTDMLPNLAFALLFLGLLWWSGGIKAVADGGMAGIEVTLKFMPLLVIVFWTVGEGMELIKIYESWVREVLSGKFGLLGAFIAAVCMPSSMTGLPIVKDLWYPKPDTDLLGADPRQKVVLITFVVVSSLIGMQVLLFRLPFLGWQITVIYLAVAIPISLVFTLGAGLVRARL